ncbi:MAG: right-handed parallel beta-helix repeat-containing protein [Coriobacteriales bacterium]|jgi:hypothetical protein|nr:right-handed parallel beta-helix repeat-containing protein [Coriobacteriales bacterium]
METSVSKKRKLSISRVALCLALSLCLSFSLVLQGGVQAAQAAPTVPVVTVSTGGELDTAIKEASGPTVISLQNDIDVVSSATYSGRQITIEGNNHTLSGTGPGTNTGLRFTQARGAGAVLNDVTVKNLTLKDLSSNLRYGGGAVAVYQGKLAIENCAFIENSNTAAASTSLTNGGGAVLSHNANNTLTITNSTFFGNSASLNGGAISSRGPATINNCTIVNNTAGIYGGAIAASSASLITLKNSIVVANEVLGATVSNVVYPGGPSDVKNLTDGGHNLLGTVDPVSATDSTPSVALDDTTAIGKTRSGLYLAAAPANNGVSGATRGAGLTLAITNASSQAIGGADPQTATLTDQRGYLRDSAPDIGAFEYASTSVDGIRAALETLVDETNTTYTNEVLGRYTTAARATLATTLADAQTVLDELEQGNPITVEAVYDVAWALASAVSDMEDSYNATICADVLRALLASGSYDADASEYTQASYQSLDEAKQLVSAIIASPEQYREDEATEALVALNAAQLNLVNISNLTYLVAYAQDEIATGKYIAASVTYVTTILNSTTALLATGTATQTEIQDATNELITALNEYFLEVGDKTALISLVAVLNAQDGSLYTPESVAALLAAIEAAEAVLADGNALTGDVSEAYDDLVEAAGSLVLRANKAALASAITRANQILADSDRYVTASLVELESALPAAVAAYDDANASQSRINSQTSALNAALAKARVIANKSKLEDLYNLLSSLSPSSYTPASFQPFSVALSNARSVLEINSQVVTQEEIDEATTALQGAYAGLVEVSAEGDSSVGTGAGATTTTGSIPNTSASSGGGTTTQGASTESPALRNAAAGSSQTLTGSASLAALPGNSDATADSSSGSLANDGSAAGTSDSASSDASPLAALTDAAVPLANSEQTPLLNWLSVSLGAIALALLVAVVLLLRKRRQQPYEN